MTTITTTQIYKNLSQVQIDIYSCIYDFFINNGYVLTKRSGGYYNNVHFYYYTSPDKLINNEHPLSKQFLLSIYDANQNKKIFFDSINVYPYNPTLEEKIFIYSLLNKIFKTLPNHHEYLSDRITSLFPISLEEDYQEIFKNIYDDYSSKSLLSKINSFNVSEFKINDIDLYKFNDYLQNKIQNPLVIDKFFLTFFRKRKAQLQNPVIGPKVRDFLMSLYNKDKDKLNLYFPFFPFLEKRLVKNEPTDVFLDNSLYMSSIKFDVKHLKKTFCIDSFTPDTYKSISGNFLEAVKDYYKVNDTNNFYDKTTPIVRLNFFHNNEKLNNNVLQTLFKNYLMFLYDNPKAPTSSKEIYSWISHYNLNLELTPKEISIKKTNKI